MKTLKIFISVMLCVVLFASCGGADTGYFKEKLQDAPAELQYVPELLADFKKPENIKITMGDKIVTYFLAAEAEGESGLEYQNINIHLKTHEENINETIDLIVDSYHSGPESAVNAVKHIKDERKYAITYEVRPDLGYTVLNIICAVSDNVSASYTMRLLSTEDVTQDILDKICDDAKMIML